MRFRHWLTGEMMGQRYDAGSQAETIADVVRAMASSDAFEAANAHIIYRGVERLKLLGG